MVTRAIKNQLRSRFFEQRVIVLYGARQVGKTTLVREMLAEFEGPAVYLNCDEPDIREELPHRFGAGFRRFSAPALQS